MSKIQDAQTKIIGYLSAVQTLLERYPVLSTLQGIKDLINGGSLDFCLNLLKLLGIREGKILDWSSELLIGKNESDTGFLDVVEIAAKNVLLLNLKSMLSCSVNPFISDDLFDEHEHKYTDNNQAGGVIVEGSGIEIDLSTIDIFGTLKHAPKSKVGKLYYFDIENYNANQLWQSRDFNAFLWYVINKGIYQDKEERSLMVWDNRNSVKKSIWNYDEEYRKNFFKLKKQKDIDDYNITHKPKKKKIIQCRFVEKGGSAALTVGSGLDSSYSYLNNKIILQVCADTYYNKRNIISAKNGYKFSVNKTIFEYNFDYLNSIKLFDSKVLVTTIIDGLTGAATIDLNYSVNELIVMGQVDNIIKKIIDADDNIINDCFFTFSNDEYDKLLNESAQKQAAKFNIIKDIPSDISLDAEELLKSLNNMTENSTLQEKQTNIKNTFTDVAATLASDGYGEISDSLNLGSLGKNIIVKLLQYLVRSLTLNILSPKVLLLYHTNAKIMGFSLPNNLEELMKSLINVIVSIIVEIKNIVVKELFNLLLSILKPIMELFANKLLLEQIKIYKELLQNLLDAILNWDQGAPVIANIDKVNYADIVKPKITPTESIC